MINPEITEAQFTQTIFNEVELAKASVPFPRTSDIDLVWAVSSTGTVYEPAELGPDHPYTGIAFDKDIVDEGVSIVRDVTALRLDKSVRRLAPSDFADAGPSLLYNGEHEGMPGNKFPMQVAHFEQYSREPGFGVPLSNVIIGDIDDVNTHAQVRQVATLLHEQRGQEGPNFDKIAAVCGIGHGIRVGRYITHLRRLMPKETQIVPAFVSHGEEREDRIAALEAGKAWQYYNKGDLALDSAFFQ